MFKWVRAICLIAIMSSLGASAAFAKLPNEVLKPYKAYRAALEAEDDVLAKAKALEAWEAAEKLLGDHKTTGDLAINYANINPTGKEKNPYKNYETRAKAFERGIELSHFYGEQAGQIEIERRIALADLDLSVHTYKRSRIGSRTGNTEETGNLFSIKKAEKAVEAHGLQGSTFDGDVKVLYTRYYQLNDQPEKAVEYADQALDIYKNRKDNFFSKYAYFVRFYKGLSHNDLARGTKNIDEKIKAALEFQVVMQNVEGALPANHGFVKTAFQSWMKVRSDIEDAGELAKAEEAGLCECWPYENYKNKPIPLKRVPAVMPPGAQRSGRVVVTFDLDDEGTPQNISVVNSSSGYFEPSAIKAVEKWEYSKRQPEADPENRKGIVTTIRYQLSDESGNIIPE